MNYEVGVRSDRNLLGFDYNVQASLFDIERKDYIMATQGDYGGTGASGGSLPQSYDNIGGVRNQGLELALKTDAKREWSLDVAYTYVDALFTKYDNFNQILGNQYGTLWAGGAFNPAAQYKLVHFNNTGKLVPRVSKNQLFSTLH